MKSGGARVPVALVAGVVLGVWLSPAPVPETKVVTVKLPPKVLTHKEVVTKVQTVPLPESCEDYVDAVSYLTQAANRIHTRGREIFNRADAIDVASLDDPTASYKFEKWVNNKNRRNSMDLHTIFEYQHSLDSALAVCRSDIEASNDGADVPRSDGSPVPRVY